MGLARSDTLRGGSAPVGGVLADAGTVKSIAIAIRKRWRLIGQVQGVGLRPFVYRIAHEQGVSGFVRNDAVGAIVEAQGSVEQLDRFAHALIHQAPPLARFDRILVRSRPARPDERTFRIETSDGDGRTTATITIDTAVCPRCRAEMNDPADRRHRYGLITCTQCGPRYSIIHRMPYDRPNTVMAAFDLCPACAREYGSPADRRFHAQPIACRHCGPQVSLVDRHGQPLTGDDPYAAAARRLAAGAIVAIKGLGGFHLACRADDGRVAARMRQLKRRDAKPFALMCRDVQEVHALVSLSATGDELLRSLRTPILIAPRGAAAARIAEQVAPDGHRLGVMLPCTPMQHLLLNDPACPHPLVMTSGNVSDQPLIGRNAEALTELGPLLTEQDAILWHDRPIARVLDDSLFVDIGTGPPIPIRRARGFVPEPITLSAAGGDGAAAVGLCVGGELKNTIALVRGGQAVLSEHLGDLTDSRAFDRFDHAIRDLTALFDLEPRWIAHDLHPQYLSTAFARTMAKQDGLTLIGVQHHHAHAAAVMAEHGRHEPVLAVVCDGVGYGDDGGIWGGELLLADRCDFTRLSRLHPLQLPGGDASARDTRRCGMALLHLALGDDFHQHPVASQLIREADQRWMLATMLHRGVGTVSSSAAGRWFDAVASLLGLCLRNDFEARAGLCLEGAAAEVDNDVADAALPRAIRQDATFTLRDDEELVGLRRIDLAPMARQLIAARQAGCPAALLARWFHRQLAAAWEAAVLEATRRTGVRCVALSGGVFCNALLTRELETRLTRLGLTVLRHRCVPPNDGGLALGQAAVALARMETQSTHRRGRWPSQPPQEQGT